MDPTSALSLFCNVLDLITAAGRTCTLLYDVHKAGTFPGHDELFAASTLLDKSLRSLTQQLSESQKSNNSRRCNDTELLDISLKARKLASDLQKKLASLQVQSTDSRSTRLEKVLKTVLQKGKVYDLKRRWEELRSAIDSALVVRLTLASERHTEVVNGRLEELSQQAAQSLSRLNDMEQQIRRQYETSRLAAIDIAEISDLRLADETGSCRQHTSLEAAKSRTEANVATKRILRHVIAEASATRRGLADDIRATQKAAARRLDRQIQSVHMETRSHIEKQIALGQWEKGSASRTARFIDSFRFPELNQRRNQISDPHSRTYEWIYGEDLKTPWDSFVVWLQSTSTMYWIHGKAGSGKSTLMHFICKHDKTQELLNKSSSPQTTTILNWYFWNSGSLAQRSLRGALCGLVCQLLCVNRDIALELVDSHARPGLRESPTDWSETELIGLLLRIFSNISGHYAIFLDGLDEFDRAEDIIVLLNLLRQLTRDFKVKVCMSSREEHRMEVHFGNLSQLRLQDLTAEDICRYISDVFAPAFPHLSDIQFDHLVEKVSSRASGVFLWVFLITKNLVQGSTNCDDYPTLMERLELLPRKLEMLYQHMWLSLNGDEDLPSYRKQTALFFSFSDHFPMPLLDLAIATNGNLYEIAGFEVQGDVSLTMLARKCRDTKLLLQTRCAGLLETVPSQSVEIGASASWNPRSNKSVRSQVRTLEKFGCVQFFHSTASQFFQHDAAGHGYLKDLRLSNEVLVERLVKTHLARRLYEVSHPKDFSSVLSWADYELQQLILLIPWVGSLCRESEVGHIADLQYSLFQVVESTYQRHLLPKWQHYLDKKCRKNWYLSITRGVYFSLPNFWGEVHRLIASSALTKIVLRHHGAEDPHFASYLLMEVCHRARATGRVHTRECLSVMQVLLDAGADPNWTFTCDASGTDTPTPFMTFLMIVLNDYIRLPYATEQDWTLIRTPDAEMIVTINRFLEHGADLSRKAVIVWHLNTNLLQSLVHVLEFSDSAELYRLGLLLSTVNGAYLLSYVGTKIGGVIGREQIDKLLASTGVVPYFRHLALMRGHDCLRSHPADPDPLTLWDKVVGECAVEVDEIPAILDKHYAHLSSHDRKVRLIELVQEQILEQGNKPGSKHEECTSSLSWSCRHWRTRRCLNLLKRLSRAVGSHEYTEYTIAGQVPCYLFTVHAHMGSLMNSTVSQAEVTATLRYFWRLCCRRYGEFSGVVERDTNDVPGRLYVELQEVSESLRIHGLTDLSFEGDNLALGSDGSRIPWCAVERQQLLVIGS